MNIKWAGPVLDPSGYAKANRGYIQALMRKNVNIKLETRFFKTEQGNEKLYGVDKWFDKLTNNDIEYSKAIYNCVPNRIDLITEKRKGLKEIGISTWETDKIPDSWVPNINNYLHKQIVPSEYNKQVYQDCNIKIPIEVVPHCLDMDFYTYDPSHPMLPNLKNNDTFVFLSVFQWTERKNPKALLKAYFTEFSKENDNVVLVLRVYGPNHSIQEQKRIKNEILQIKNDLNIKETPNILFIGDMLTEKEMVNLYHECDCFVLPSRSEGFGLPYLEAMACGCPCIGTNYGAAPEIIDDGKTGFLIDSRETPVYGMSWINQYDGYQLWGDPDIMHLRYLMRLLYDNSYSYCVWMGDNSLKSAQTNYNLDAVGDKLLKAIE
ncbi:MAG: glycosyltransferase family 4 protein [Bacteroidota bacterium]